MKIQDIKRKKKNTMQGILFTIGLILLAIGFMIAFYKGMKASEKVECIKWKSWEEQGYIGYYVTEWQVEQCKQYGVEFYSEVRK